MIEKFSVKKPMTVFVAVILVLVLGVVSFMNMTPDLMPNLDLPYVMVMTTYPGQSPESVEKTVSAPLESSMATIENIKNVNSTSAENYSLITLEFEDNTNMDSATIDIRGKIDTVKAMWPEGVGAPVILKINPNIMPAEMVAVNYEGKDRRELSRYLNDKLLNQLEGIDGVAGVTTLGVLEESENVVINQSKINALNDKIENALNEKFGEAEDQLNEAKQTISDNIEQAGDGAKQLDSAKQQLNAKQQEVSAQLADASGALSAKQLELLQTKLQLMNKEDELLSQKQQLQAVYEQLAKLKESYDRLTLQKQELEGKYEFLDELNKKYTELKAQL